MSAERVSALFWLTVGLISIYGSTHLGFGTLREPGSGFLSLLAGCFICLMAIIVFFQSYFSGDRFPLKSRPSGGASGGIDRSPSVS